jgi:hypothetical protein
MISNTRGIMVYWSVTNLAIDNDVRNVNAKLLSGILAVLLVVVVAVEPLHVWNHFQS